MTRPSKGLEEFIAEATEILDTLGQDLLVVDERRGQEVEPELLNGIFRAAHSLKGLSAMFGQDRIATLAHKAEDLLDRVRLGKLALTDLVVDALIEALDVFQLLLSELAETESTDGLGDRASNLAERFDGLGAPSTPVVEDPLERVALDPQILAVFTEYEEHRLRENLRRGVAIFRVRAAFDLSDFDTGLAKLNGLLKPVGEVISTLPSAEPGDGTGIAFDLIFGSKVERAELEQAVAGMPVQLRALAEKATGLRALPEPEKPVAAPSGKAKEPSRSKRGTKKQAPKEPAVEEEEVAPPPPAISSLPLMEARPSPSDRDVSLRSLTRTVRVDIERLDGLMNAVGELLLIKANVQRLAESAQVGVPVGKLFGQELGRESRLLQRRLDELQKGLLAARMVPLGQIFDRLSRLVRRIGREAGKELDFAVSGGDVELDKLIVEELSDPLMHLIRNAIDHGVELPELRVAQGKPRRARVSLRAVPQGNHVVIEIQDDGAGLNEERILEVAMERGLVSAEKARELSRRDIQNLIFLPGFSTARAVSTLSGRGVGLDVVKTNIGHLSGIIDVASEPGQGTRFTLTLPVTLAILRALVVSVTGRTYAVPLNSVLEIISVEARDIRTVEGREVVTLRGQTLPFARLARLFGLPEQPLGRHFVVVVGLAQERLGIAVDSLLGQQDIVTKPLGGRLRTVRGIAGATDLGNRRTVLVLDVGALMEDVIRPDTAALERTP